MNAEPGVAWSVAREGDRLRLAGDWDGASAGTLRARLLDEVAAGATEADLTGLGFCGAAGIRALLDARDAAHQRGGDLTLVCPAWLARLFAICGAEDHFVGIGGDEP